MQALRLDRVGKACCITLTSIVAVLPTAGLGQLTSSCRNSTYNQPVDRISFQKTQRGSLSSATHLAAEASANELCMPALAMDWGEQAIAESSARAAKQSFQWSQAL